MVTTAGADLVQTTSASSSTGTITLAATPYAGNPRAQAVPASFDGRPGRWLIEHSSIQSEWELVTGVYTHSTLALTRPTANVILGTNGPGANTDFSPGGLIVSNVQAWDDIDAILVKLEGIAAGAGSPKADTSFSTDLVISDADAGLRYAWVGTSPGRVSVPSGLSEGVTVEIVSQSTTANLAPLTIERASGDGNRRVGGPIGCRLLRLGGRGLIRKEADTPPRIELDGDPAAMAAQNGGASFLLESALLQSEVGGVLQSWGDKYGLRTFDVVVGEPGIDEDGQMTVTAGLGVSTRIRSANIQFAGTSLLFGFAMRVTAIVGTNMFLVSVADTANGRGLYLHDNFAGGGFNIVVMTNAGVTATLSGASPPLGRPFAGAVAINRTAGYAHAFFDEGRSNRERHAVLNTTFVSDWTAAPISFASVGPPLLGSQSVTCEYPVVNLRDNVTFASVNDARDQAAAMLAEMRGYYP